MKYFNSTFIIFFIVEMLIFFYFLDNFKQFAYLSNKLIDLNGKKIFF